MSFTLRRRQAPQDLMRCSFRRAAGVLMTRQGDELVLLDTRRERYYTLNDVGAVAWRVLEEPAACTAIVNVIRREFDMPVDCDPAVVTSDVVRLLDQLLAAGLVTVESTLSETVP